MTLENNIAASMASLLDPQETKKLAAAQDAQQALVALAKAAEIMENLDLTPGAEVATVIMESVSEKL